MTQATETRKHKSKLMTMFLLDFEKVTGQRVTMELIRSKWWKDMRQAYIDIFLPLAREKETKKNVHSSDRVGTAVDRRVRGLGSGERITK